MSNYSRILIGSYDQLENRCRCRQHRHSFLFVCLSVIDSMLLFICPTTDYRRPNKVIKTSAIRSAITSSATFLLFAFVTRRPYCPGRPKKLCFTTLSLAPTVLTARLCMVKQSFFGLPGQYGRRVTKANYHILMTSVIYYLTDS